MALFGFGGKQTKIEEAPDAPPSLASILPSALEAGKVHEETVFYTMPAKFLTPETPPFWTSGKIWGVVILLAAGVVGAVYLLLSSAAPPTATDTANTISSASPAPPTPEPSPAEPSNALTNEPAPPETPTEPPVEPAPTEPTPPPPVAQLPSSMDADVDGLTDAEEILYGTDSVKPDSDGDGFTDKQELVNGYNPTGGGRLVDSTLVKTYTSATTPQFTISYPAAWSVERASEGENIRFIASPDEFMSVGLESNGENLFLLDWYSKIFTTTDIIGNATETVGKHVGIFSPDRQTFYFIDSNNSSEIFVVSYNSGTKTELNYRTAFEFLIGSIAVVK